MHARQARAHAWLTGGADDDRERGCVFTLDDVGDDDGDVVRCAAGQGEIDELGHAHRRLTRAEDARDLVVRHDPVQAITAEQVSVAQPCLAHREIRLGHLHPVERAHEEIAARVGVRLLLGDAPRVDEGLDVGVVVRDLAEFAVAQEVAARVAHVHDGDACGVAVGEPVQARDGGAHAGELGTVGDDEPDGRPGALDGLGQPGECLALAQVLIGDVGQRGHRGGAGELAAGVPTHAVGHDEQARGGVSRVLVALAHDTHVRARGVPQCECHGHRCNCRVVRPIRRGTPGGSTVGEVMRVRSIQVPLVEPRSSTIQPSSLGYRRAWRLEA